MGNKQPYERLLAHPQSEIQQPLLHQGDNNKLTKEMKSETEANCKKNGSSSMVKMKNKVHDQSAMQLQPVQEIDKGLKKEMDKLCIRVMNLELDTLAYLKRNDIETLEKKHAELENKIKELSSTIHRLEAQCFNLMNKGHFEKLVDNPVASENRALVLSSTIDQPNAPSSDSMATDSSSLLIPEISLRGPDMNDLIGCLLVLIFLISVLIVVNL